MRRTNQPFFLRDDQGRVIALNLGADFCAEHEWGIEPMQAALGIRGPADHPGIEGRRATKLPDGLRWVNLPDGGALMILLDRFSHEHHGDASVEWLWGDASVEQWLWGELSIQDQEICAAWCDSRFGVRVASGLVADLQQVFDSFVGGGVAVWLGGDSVFQNAGLVLAIVDRIPADAAERMMGVDIDRGLLTEAAEATGIKDVLRKAGRRWFALTPRWATKEEEAKTKHPVTFWLNPFDQDANNYGQFTVEELTKWAQGTGPIVKQRRGRR